MLEVHDLLYHILLLLRGFLMASLLHKSPSLDFSVNLRDWPGIEILKSNSTISDVE